jgi:putative DNA primase/helicase
MLVWADLPHGKSRQPCPECGRGPSDKTMGVTLEAYSAVAHCFRCGHVEFTSFTRARIARKGLQPPRASPQALSEMGSQIWASCVGLTGTPGESYLRSRRCCVPPREGHLRYAPRLRHPLSQYSGPALVALVTDAKTGQPLTLHRTWINSDGTKAALNPSRMLLGGHRKAGGVIRLWPEQMVDGVLGVAEGIETALSLALQGLPAWSVVDAGNLSNLAVLDSIDELVIAVDHDQAGIAAANACSLRWNEAGKTVSRILPPVPGQDLNDMVGDDYV